jgi:hypothetical protein
VTVPGRAKRGEHGADHTYAAGSQQDTQILGGGGRPWCGLAVLAHVVTLPILTTYLSYVSNDGNWIERLEVVMPVQTEHRFPLGPSVLDADGPTLQAAIDRL